MRIPAVLAASMSIVPLGDCIFCPSMVSVTCSVTITSIFRSYPWLPFADGVVLSQRMSLKFFIHQDAVQVRVPCKTDSEHIPHFALQPVGGSPQWRQRIQHRDPVFHLHLQSQAPVERKRYKVVDNVETRLPL